MSDQERMPLILSLVPKGNPEFPRYLICDQWGNQWNGSEWVEQGFLYANSNDACQEMQRILLASFDGAPKRQFRAPLYLDLYCDQPVTKRDIHAWLVRVARLLFDTPKEGNGPVEGSLGLLRIEWAEMEEIDVDSSRTVN